MNSIFMTPEEVAAELKVEVVTVKNMITAGKLPAVPVGNTYRIKRHDLENLSTGVRSGPPQKGQLSEKQIAARERFAKAARERSKQAKKAAASKGSAPAAAKA